MRRRPVVYDVPSWSIAFVQRPEARARLARMPRPGAWPWSWIVLLAVLGLVAWITA